MQWPRHGQHHLHQHHLQGCRHGSGLETRPETVDQQQQDQQRLSDGKLKETLDETQVGLYQFLSR